MSDIKPNPYLIKKPVKFTSFLTFSFSIANAGFSIFKNFISSILPLPKILFRHPLLLLAALFTILWFSPVPQGLSLQAWHLFAIFAVTIIGIIANVLPMGAMAVIALALCTLTHTLTIKEALSSFSSHIVWLILLAFLLARGFIKTGLGSRIAYYFVLNMGKNTLGLSYGLIATEFLLAPFTPSNTARGAGIVYPIIHALSQEYGSNPAAKTERKIGSFLMKLGYQANVISSAMFLTATAANPLLVNLASKFGIELTWGTWALAAFIPGIISLICLPLLLYIFYTPELKSTPEAPEFARKKLSELGPLSKQEWIMLGTFGLLLTLWILGPNWGIDATSAALLGLSILLISNVLTWDDILKEQNAWHTFIWLTTLLMLSNYLAEFGMMSWISDQTHQLVGSLSWIGALTVITLLYFYSHYAFASITAHVSALFSPLVMVALAAGAPPMLSILLFTFASSICAGITHYGTGTGPVYFGSNYITIRDWWRVGGIISIFNMAIWLVAGLCWWSLLGLI